MIRLTVAGLITLWAMFGYQEAKKALDNVRAELEPLNPGAARSLAEGLEESLTIHRLRVPEKLRKTLFSTSPIESAFSVVEGRCGRVKKWQGGYETALGGQRVVVCRGAVPEGEGVPGNPAVYGGADVGGVRWEADVGCGRPQS